VASSPTITKLSDRQRSKLLGASSCGRLMPSALGVSVVVKGTAEMITNPYDIVLAKALPLNPWAPTAKSIFVRITPTDVTGRHFSFGTVEER
jgi:hypothetical protein